MFLELTVRDNKKNKSIDNRKIYINANSINYMVRRSFPDNVHFTELFLTTRMESIVVLESQHEIMKIVEGSEIE